MTQKTPLQVYKSTQNQQSNKIVSFRMKTEVTPINNAPSSVINNLHYLIFGDYPDKQGKNYWEDELSRNGINSVIEKMRGGRKVSFLTVYQNNRHLIDSSIYQNRRFSPLFTIINAYKLYHNRLPELDEIKQCFHSLQNEKLGYIELKFRIAALNGTISPKLGLSKGFYSLKILSYGLRKFIHKNFQIIPFKKQFIYSDLALINSLEQFESLKTENNFTFFKIIDRFL